MNKKKYITTAIVYPNSRIHVGWAWECLGADWLARTWRAFGEDVFFVTGMDEHSIKVQRAAEAKNLTPQAYCDQMGVDIEKVLKQMGLSYDRFIRTSDPDHVFVVQKLIQKAFDKGDIYLSKYEGFYCEGCEAFYTEKDLENGICPQHKKPPKVISEENYFFRLSKYQERLLKLFDKNSKFLQPEFRKSEILNFIEAGLKDFSISRSTFSWGIPLPFDPKHVVYVWFDALINYLTAAGFELKLRDKTGEPEFDATWPATVHVIGKDISRFHSVYWPAMLMSVDICLPEQVFVHGFINIKGDRLSKSAGNIVTPDEVMSVSGPDPFRYYLLSENQFSQDGNFSLESLIYCNNANLSNDWGNLVNRSISMTRKYFPNETLSLSKQYAHSKEIQKSFESLLDELRNCVDRMEPSDYIKACVSRSRLLNLYIDKTKPWILAKKESTKIELYEVLYTLLEGIRFLATAYLPVLPFKMPDVFSQLGLSVPQTQGALKDLKWGSVSYCPLEPSPIYPRLEV
ncbi:MAG: methionine--tRNA ligase [Deltaproteobacteria bacterium]|nr:methionine--tRNA ligase [Deltaproteobacteria bacterium]